MKMTKEPTFLIVDDLPSMLQLIRRSLIKMGFSKIEMATSGQDAMRCLENSSIDCIISDWNMPNVSGLELLKFVRQSQETLHVPFMLVTAEVQRESVNMAIAEGVNEFLVRPFTAAAFQSKVKSLITQQGRPPQANIGVEMRVGEETAAIVNSSPEQGVILVVDDAPINIDVITGILSETYRVLAATSGEKALKIASTEHLKPDLILLDIMMPEMDGLEVCQRLKDNPDTESIPVIFLTAKTEVDDVTAGLELGAVDYIAKPVNPAILKARVKTQLRLKYARDDLAMQLDTIVENAKLRVDAERITRHDLKNPLAVVINTAETLLDGSTWMAIEQKNDIELIRSTSYTILDMINRSLDLYKMEVGNYKLKPELVDVVSIAYRVVEASRTNAHKFGVSVLFKGPENCFITGEKLLCFSMLNNLIRNAIEASPTNGKVSVTILNDEKVKINIHNEQVIPIQIRDTFFDKYVTKGKEGGTGLGAYSAKLMANIQQGDISFETSNQAGTTISVMFDVVSE